MSEGIVDHLEPVEVERTHHDDLFGASRLRNGDLQLGIEQRPVRKPGHPVVVSDVVELLLRAGRGEAFGPRDDHFLSRRYNRRGNRRINGSQGCIYLGGGQFVRIGDLIPRPVQVAAGRIVHAGECRIGIMRVMGDGFDHGVQM